MRLRATLWGCVAGLLAPLAALAQAPRLLDDMKDAGRWTASASDQVRASLARERDGSLCLNYDFAGVSGYAVMRRELAMDWPEDFVLQARLRGRGDGNDLQLKLVDASGDNVWWVNRPALALPRTLTELAFKRRHVSFAWGPTPDRQLRSTRFLEFTVVAGQQGGGRGQLCVAALKLQPRLAAPAAWPAPQRSDSPGQTVLDHGRPREFNGLWLQWPQMARGLDYRLEASQDGQRWTLLREVQGSDGGSDALYLPEQEWRWLRLRYPRGQAAPRLALRDAAQWPDRNAMLSELARGLPRGEMPRAFVGEQNYWTVVGVDGGAQHAGLISEDGAIELDRGGPSIEPLLLLADGRSLGWAQVQMQHGLREDALPLPSVQWQHEAAGLRVEATADGPARAPRLLARYTVSNPGPRPQRLSLLLLLRPWQVNPPQQFLSTPGGITALRSLRWQDGRLRVQAGEGGAPAWQLRFSSTPQRITATGLDGGLGLASLRQGLALEPGLVFSDPQGSASALLRFDLDLGPGEQREIGWVSERSGPAAPSDSAKPRRASSRAVDEAPAPDAPPEAAPPEPGAGTLSAQALAQRFEQSAARWQQRLGRVRIELPPPGRALERNMRSALAQILMSREGPALRPGTRSYARSWVRDGAMMVAGLLRMGEQQAAREFVDWFAGYIFESGKVPCCVDQRGADPVTENDSHGQYLYAVAELWRHTQDRALLERHWPQVQRVLAWMEALRQSERGAANRTPERLRFFGLMPPSISHEGYADKPAYAYWDDFWALRGYQDAVQIAQALGQPALARRWAGWRDEFARELSASIAMTAGHYRLDHIAGAADRGDFDASSTTMALNPAQMQDRLAAPLLQGTFERYWVQALARAEGRLAWKDYTPYELRNVSALLRLGQPERAHRLLDFFFRDQRPAGWNQWAEVVLPDPREPRFLGDMPHAWVSSDYLRAALDLLAYEDEPRQDLVLGAGVLPAWREAGDLRVAGLSTAYGRLDYSLTRRPGGGWTLAVAHRPERLPGALRLAWPGEGALPRAVHAGRALAWDGRELVLPPGLSSIELEP